MFIINNYFITIALYILFSIMIVYIVYKLIKKLKIYNLMQPIQILLERRLILT